jgi:SNF2 family DNA or RNA helicase
VLLYIKKQKGFSKFSKEGYEPAYTSIYLKYGIQREIRIKIGSDNKEEFEQLAKKYFDENFVFRKESYNKFENLLEKARTINTSFKCYSDALEYIIDIREANRRELMINNLVSSGEWENYLGNILKVKPFPFQVEGIAFACKAGKTLNADEMGLGKTLQAIGAAEVLKREFHISKVLIICPTSLKYQWKSEIEKFAQSDSIVIEGHALKREAQYSEESFYKIASYNVVGSDIKQINSYSPDLVILDEAQRIKNWKTKVAQNVKKIRSPHTIVLTGTPLENKLEELVSIVQFVDPFKLGPLHRFLEKHQVKDEAGKVIGYKNLNEIGNILSDIMIRRLKAEVLTQLPERSDKNLFVPMTDKQSQLHNEFNDTVARLVNKWRRFGFLNEQDRQRLMINLNRMRMVCDSTYIIDQETRHDTKIDELMCILDKAFQMNGNKVVVFSQWERMTRLVAAELEKRNLKYEYLHGGIASKDRGQLLLNFRENKDSKVFLSTDAGGVGLNLQSASLLINLDIPWNPAVLEQRIGRVYRYGQKQNVSIINFVATGTIEHKMLDVIKFKSSIAQGILDDGEDNVFLGDDKFKEFMKTVDSIVTSESIKQVAEETEQEQEIYLEDRKEKPLVLTTEVSRLLSEDEDTSIEKQKTKETDAAVDKQVAALFTSAIDFVNKLSQTLPDSKSTEKLISSLIERDEKSGKSYIKIPIENEEIVGNAINAFSGFVKMLKGL